MKKKDNSNVQESFQQFLLDSDLKKYVPTILMSDNDSTFVNTSFQVILEKNKIIHQPNILDDHHALGLIDRFARTIKTILTRLYLQNKTTNWIDYFDVILNNYNNSGHIAIDNIKPNDAFLKQHFETIYNIFKHRPKPSGFQSRLLKMKCCHLNFEKLNLISDLNKQHNFLLRTTEGTYTRTKVIQQPRYRKKGYRYLWNARKLMLKKLRFVCLRS